MKRVLITDDEDSILGLFRHWFMHYPHAFAVDFASGGAEALAAYQQAQEAGAGYDVMVLDISMPDVSGLTVARSIREAGDNQTKIVFCTAHDGVQNHHAAEDVQASAYLVKPLTSVELHSTIDQVLALAEVK